MDYLDYSDLVKAIDKQGKNKYFINTFGCQMNAHDSEKLAGMLESMGYEECESEKEADLVIFNTCCIRENAENKVYGNLGYLKHVKEEGKDLKIVLCGCMTQQDAVIEKLRKSFSFVDIIFGTFNLHKFPMLLHSNLTSKSRIIDIWKEHGDMTEDLPQLRQSGHKASINIMYGCNNFCTYCIVPYVRGREKSRPVEDILREAKALAADNVKELMLLGQNVNSYGKDFENGESFAGLLRKISETDGIERIRFMTSHPKDLSDELILAIKDIPKICGHLHLPFQSGSSRILKKMNRKYSKDEYLSLIEKVKKEIPDIALTTDIIVGFPGETEEDFEETLDLVKRCGFSGAYTFLYSKRTGTPAAVMEDQVPEETAKARFNRLVAAVNPIIRSRNESQIGKTLRVLVDEKSREGVMTGRAEDNSLVHFEGGEELIGTFVDVKIEDCVTFYLSGVKIN